ATRFGSQEVLEVVFAADAAPETEDLRLRRRRAELDIVARPVPYVTRAAQELVRLVAAVSVDAERVERQVDHSHLPVVRIDVHHREHDISEVVRALRVGEDLVVLGRVEHESVVALQRRVLASHLVDQGDELAKALRAVALPAADLVLLRVEVLLRPRLFGTVLTELESWSID